MLKSIIQWDYMSSKLWVLIWVDCGFMTSINENIKWIMLDLFEAMILCSGWSSQSSIVSRVALIHFETDMCKTFIRRPIGWLSCVCNPSTWNSSL
jgi:hypothetical protein